MPGSLAAKLTEVADVIERDRRIAQPLVVGIHGPRPGQVEQRPEQHRGVAVREHEAVAAGPDRIHRIEAHDAIPERVDQRRERHRRAGVTGVGRLDRIYRQRPNGVDGELIHLRTGDRGRGHGRSFQVARGPRPDLVQGAECSGHASPAGRHLSGQWSYCTSSCASSAPPWSQRAMTCARYPGGPPE